MKLHYFQHVAFEGPGSISRWAASKNYPMSITRWDLGETPVSTSKFDLLVVMGGTIVGTLTLTNTTLQVTTPQELRGRIMAMYYMAMAGLMPFGSLQAGAIAQAFSTRFALELGGVVCLLYFLILQVSLNRLRRAGQLSGSARKA